MSSTLPTWALEALSDTAGTAWSAVSGTVDPWTEQLLEEGESSDLEQAGLGVNAAVQTAAADVENTLENFTGPGGIAGFTQTFTGAAPSDFWAGVNNTFQTVIAASQSVFFNLKSLLILIAIAAGAIALLLFEKDKPVPA